MSITKLPLYFSYLVVMFLILPANIFGQNTVEVTVFEDSNGNGIDDDAIVISGIPMADLILWQDVNNNGVVDGGDLSINYTSETGGVYTFDGGGTMPDGNYILQYMETPGIGNYYITTPLVGAPSPMDSDVDDATGYSSPFMVSGGITETDIDLGLWIGSEIGNLVWDDLNGNGLTDAGEPGIQGVTVSLFDAALNSVTDADGNPVAPATTDVNGNYLFQNLPPGDYIIEFSLPAPIGTTPWYPTTFNGADPDFSNDSDADPNNSLRSPVLTLPSGYFNQANNIINMAIDAGFYVPVEIGDKVFCDENGNGIDDDGAAGVDGVTVRLIDNFTGMPATDPNGTAIPDQITSGGGMYLFQNVPPGNYHLEFVPLGTPFVFTTKDEPSATETTDSDVDPNTFVTDNFDVESKSMMHEMKWDAGVYQTFVIKGNVWVESDMNNMFDGEGGPGGVQINLYDAATNMKIDFVNTNTGVYQFPSNNSVQIGPGTYYLEIDASAFASGGPLNGTTPCPGNGDANDMVDNDDNGMDAVPATTTTFTLLSNCDPNTPPMVEYIDFCYFFNCSAENDLASLSCSEITSNDIICDIEGILGAFCNLMPTDISPGTQPVPLCPDGGAPHNISWFAFVAYDGSYTVTVTPTNCTGDDPNSTGVQIGLYTDCTFTEEVYCNPNCNTNPVSFDSNTLTPGQTYYFFIDGCNGSVCSYEVEITGNPLPPNLTPNSVCIDDNGNIICDDNQTYCPGADITFVADGINLTVDFTWSVTVLSGGPYTGNATQMTDNETLQLNFANEGEYQVCLNEVNNGCAGMTWSGNMCRTVTIQGLADEDFGLQTVCVEDLPSFDISVFSGDDPNGDGTLGWQGNNSGFMSGTNTYQVTTPEGCMYEQSFDLMTFPPSSTGVVDTVVCSSDLPVMIGEIQVTELSFAGDLTFSLNDYLLTSTNDVNGCDTSINLTVEQLTILNGGFADPVCLPEGIYLNFTFDQLLSSDIQYMTFTWTDPAGNVITDTNVNPQDIVAPNASGSGTYTLTVAIAKNGASCDFSFTIDIDFDSFYPPQPMLSGDLTVCEGDNAVTYEATNGGDAFTFVWDYPSDVASATISGNNDEMLTIDWTGSAGGDVTVHGMNACGVSTDTTITVQVIPQSTPGFTIASEICKDSTVMIEFTGDGTNVSTYTWDFDGGTVSGTGGVGPGPHPVSWSTPGDKIITLSVIENGCPSKTDTQMISVIAPIQPPTVACNPALGEVTFTWDDVPGATGYDVIVLSGQSGTLSGNSFTVTGLAENETVNIELIVFTNDACQMVIGTAPGCTAQDCVPPMIDLVPDQNTICLTPDAGTIDINANITSGETGTGIWSGNGITDTLMGVFDPSVAGVGSHSINYTFTTVDDCIGNATTTIEVLEVPTADFTIPADTICITDQVPATFTGTAGVTSFDWDYGDGGTASGGANPSISYNSPGLKTITLSVEKEGCISESITKQVFVQPELAPIVVTCTEQNINSVTFGWNDITGATGYEVIINGGSPITTTSLDTLIDGLMPGDIVNIVVNVLTDSRCPASSDQQSCEAKACPTFDIAFNLPSTNLCVDANSSPIVLDANATGGVGGGVFTWTGDNVSGNMFDPKGLTDGEYQITVEYEENGCSGSKDTTFVINNIIEATFDVSDDTICITDPINIDYTGLWDPQDTFVLDWNFEDLDVDANLIMFGGHWQLKFNNPGTYDVALVVDNDGCISPTVMHTVVVEPELVFAPISCAESLDQITFSWNPMDCASQFDVVVDGVSQGMQSDTSITITGLTEGQEVSIEVLAISDCECGDVMQTMTCEAQACPQVGITLSAPVTEFCLGENPTPVQIIDEVTNSTSANDPIWMGQGVNDQGMFDPVAAGPGVHIIGYMFEESVGCIFMDSITFTVFESPSVDFIIDEITCYDQDTASVTINATGGTGPYSIQSNGQVIASQTNFSIGTHDILVTDDNGCTAMGTFVINSVPKPTPTISGNPSITIGESSDYMIDPNTFAGLSIDSIVWTANGSVVCDTVNCWSIHQSPTENTQYMVVIYYNDGCSVSAQLDVEVNEPPMISIVTIPDAISPNGDGVNDEWVIFSNDEEVIVHSIKIYDRWGNLVFTVDNQFVAKGNNVTWDGKKDGKSLIPGVYVYFIDFVQEGRQKVRSGDITLVK